MKNELNDIKNKIYESEGLIELLNLRLEKKDELLPMIERRIDEVLQNIRSLMQAPESEESVNTINDESQRTESESQEDDDIDDDIYDDIYVVEDNGFVDKSDVRTPPSFCVNDRYRFKRSIFGGSTAEFNSAMELLTTLPDYQKAEQYFMEDMGLDPEDQDVIDFMEIIKNYFNV